MEHKVGLIGLGNAGLALATAIARKHRVVGYDRISARCDLARAQNVEIASSPAKLAEQCDVIMLCLPNPSISLAVLKEMEQGLTGRLIIENSTIGPDDTEALLAIAARARASLIESAILGGVRKLSEGKGTFLVGASEADFQRAKPILEAAAEKIFHLGPLGNGMRVKLVCNAVAHAVMVVLIEAATLAAAQRIPMDVFYELMHRESGLMRPLTHRIRERIFPQSFEGGMTTANARKDSALILEVAKELGVPLFAISAAHTPYEIAMSEGLEAKDYASLSKLWEKWAGVSLASSTGNKEEGNT